MKKRLLLLYASYGTGHRSVCNYIEKYFKESGKYEVKSIDLLHYSMPIIGSLSKKFFERLILKHPYLWDGMYNFFDNKVNSSVSNKISLTVFDNKKNRKEITEFDPDICISTHFMGSALVSKYNKKELINSKLVTIVTDYKAHEFWLRNNKGEDAIIVSSLDEKLNLILKGINPRKIKTFGIPISKEYIENIYDHNEVRKKLNVPENEELCLFYGGGGCGQTTSIPFIKELLNQDLKLNILFVSGNNHELEDKVKKLVKRYNNHRVKVYGFITNGAELLTACDYVITKPGGVTVTECLVNHKPMILLKTVGGQEKGNCNFLTRKGYAKSIKNPQQLSDVVKFLLKDPSEIKRMQQRMEQLENKKPMENLYALANNLVKNK